MIKTIIVDDEVKVRQLIRQMCDRFTPVIKVVGEAGNPQEAMQLFEVEMPDLIFLDIEMPGMTGIEMLRQMGEIPFEVVFVTAFNRYAVEAFRLGAVDYLLKPPSTSDLQEAVQRVEKNLKLKTQDRQQVKNVVQSFGKPLDRITIPTINGFEFIDFEDLVYLKGEGSYTTFFLKDGSQVLTAKTLGDFQEMMELHQFFRVHKSFIINLKKIKKYTKGEGGTVTMSDGTEIDVSRRRKEEFLTLLKS